MERRFDKTRLAVAYEIALQGITALQLFHGHYFSSLALAERYGAVVKARERLIPFTGSYVIYAFKDRENRVLSASELKDHFFVIESAHSLYHVRTDHSREPIVTPLWVEYPFEAYYRVSHDEAEEWTVPVITGT